MAQLNEEDIDRLSRIMLFGTKGQPLSNGHLRYRYLIKKLEQAYLKNNKGPLKLRTIYQSRAPENSLFTEKADNSIQFHTDLRTELYQILKSVKLTRVSYNDAAILAVLLLVIESRITSKELLTNVLNKAYRLVTFRKQYYLEYGQNLDRYKIDAVVQRFIISRHCAYLLNKYSGKATTLNLKKLYIPSKLQALFKQFEASQSNGSNVPEQLITIAGRVEQANAIELPGIVCAWLAGRVDSYSLSWNDWVRLEQGKSLDWSEYIEPCQTLEQQPETELLSHLSSKPDSEDNAVQATRKLFKELRQALKAAVSVKANRSVSKNKRRDLFKKIDRIIQVYDGQVGSAIILVSRWLQQFVLQRKRSSGERAYLKISSVERYLSSISKPFSRIAGAVDLLSMDEQEVTQFYNDLIDSVQSEEPSYFCERLISFHHYAHKQGVVDPQWDDIPLVDTPQRVSP